MVNDCTFIGNLGKDPEVKMTENEHKVARFSIACGEKVKKPETGETVEYTEWVNIILWDKLADVAEQYLKKGMQVYVHGRMRTRSYEGNDKITNAGQEDRKGSDAGLSVPCRRCAAPGGRS